MKVRRIGVDLAKHMFQVHGVDDHDTVVVRKPRTRGNMRAFCARLPPCLVGRDACASAHSWAREWGPLGHTVRLMAPPFGPPSRKHPKHDGHAAEALGEAVSRPPMRVVPITSVEQQAVLTVPRARALLVRNRTALANPMRGWLAEDGMVVPHGIARLRRA